MYLKPFVFDDFVVQLNIFIDTPDQTCFVNSQTYQLMPLQLKKKKKKKICFQISGANAWEVVRWWLLEVVSSLDLPLSQVLHHAVM